MTTIVVLPQTLDLYLYAGDGFNARFTFKNLDNTPFAIPGEWRAQIRKSAGHPEVLDTFTVTVDSDNGVLNIALTGEQTDALPPRSRWDLQQTPPESEPRTWYRGGLYFDEDVSE